MSNQGTKVRDRKVANTKQENKSKSGKQKLLDGSGDSNNSRKDDPVIKGGSESETKTVNEKTSVVPSEKLVKSKNKKVKSKDKGAERDSNQLLSSICGKAKYLFLIIFIPPFLNYASLQRESVELKPPGELYDIGWDQKLFLSCQGKGPPTVLLDAPTGMSSDVWALVVDTLSEHANVCIYDRAGLGFSERPFNRSTVTQGDNGEGVDAASIQASEKWEPFTVERMVDNMRKLISTSSQQPLPLILVGAEMGALVAQFYAHVYEGDVAGLVLVNPLPDDLFQQSDGAWAHHWFHSISPTYQTLQLGAALGITRLGLIIGAMKQPITGQLVPEDVIIRQKYLMCNPRHLSSVVDEHHFINQTLSQMRTLRMIKSLATNISVSVLTGNYYDEQMPSHLNKAWARAEQNLLTRYYPNAQHLVVNDADRHMMYRKPRPIIEATLRLIRRWKKSHSLKGSKSL